MEAQKQIREFPATEGEDFEHFMSLVRMFRKYHIEVIAVYNGIKFYNMDGKSVEEAYEIAFQRSSTEKELSKQKNEDLQQIAIEQVKLFIAANKGNDHLTTEEIMEFLNQISSLHYINRELSIPQDLINEVLGILRNVGYEPIEPEKAYLTTNEGKKGYQDCLVWETVIKFPQEGRVMLSKDPESISTVAIRNAMLQLQNEGNVDWRTSKFYMIYHKLKGKVLNYHGY